MKGNSEYVTNLKRKEN